jgi:hypothetical protein
LVLQSSPLLEFVQVQPLSLHLLPVVVPLMVFLLCFLLVVQLVLWVVQLVALPVVVLQFVVLL